MFATAEDPLVAGLSNKVSRKGTYSSAEGVPSEVKCIKCPPGKAGNKTGQSSEATGCSECDAGKYTQASGQASCQDCTEGSSTKGSSYCSPCPAGHFLNRTTTPPSCSKCQAGSFALAASARCTSCQPGKYSIPDRTECKLCPAGTFSNKTNATSSQTCRECPRGPSRPQGLRHAHSQQISIHFHFSQQF